MTRQAISAAFAQVGPGVRAIMVFDSSCVLCSGTVQWVIRHDPNGRVAFAGTDSAAGARLYAMSGHDANATFLLVTRDDVQVRSDAGLALLEIFGAVARLDRGRAFGSTGVARRVLRSGGSPPVSGVRTPGDVRGAGCMRAGAFPGLNASMRS